MARRMTPRLRLLIGVALLPLALFAFLPMVSGAQKNLGSKIERKKDQIAWRKGRERVLSSDVAGYTRRINDAAGRHHGAADQAGAAADQPRPQARGARAHPGGPAPRAAAARPPARPPGRGARRALQAARRALQGRPARPGDRRARVQRLRRPARAHGVHAARLPPGRADHQHRRAGQEGGDRHRQAARQAREARPGRRRPDRGRGDQVAAVKGQLVDRRGRYADARADKSSLLASTREDRHSLEGDLRELVAAQARVSAALQASSSGSGSAPAGPSAPARAA